FHPHHIISFLLYHGSNNSNQRPLVNVGEQVDAYHVLANGPSMEQGQLALGQNPLIALMTWQGYNFEDAIAISERLVKDDVYTSIHIESYESEARETKLRSEERRVGKE